MRDRTNFDDMYLKRVAEGGYYDDLLDRRFRVGCRDLPSASVRASSSTHASDMGDLPLSDRRTRSRVSVTTVSVSPSSVTNRCGWAGRPRSWDVKVEDGAAGAVSVRSGRGGAAGRAPCSVLGASSGDAARQAWPGASWRPNWDDADEVAGGRPRPPAAWCVDRNGSKGTGPGDPVDPRSGSAAPTCSRSCGQWRGMFIGAAGGCRT